MKASDYNIPNRCAVYVENTLTYQKYGLVFALQLIEM